MTTATAKVKTCSRCKGTGMVNARVAHIGVPGLCYSCDGCGRTRHFTKAQRIEKFVSRCEAHLAELIERAEGLKQARETWRVEKPNRPARLSHFDREIEQLREAYRIVRGKLRAAQAGKISANDQPSYEPAR